MGMRAAIVHYWLLNWRGGEKVLESLCRLLPDADIFTLFYDPRAVSPEIRRHNVTASFLNPLRRYYRELLPLMPLALEQFDLSGYDLVISSESGPAKGVITSSQTCHICYCHSPLRYIWEMYPQYRRAINTLVGTIFSLVAHYMRLWDVASAGRVDYFVANSQFIASRIRKYYG